MFDRPPGTRCNSQPVHSRGRDHVRTNRFARYHRSAAQALGRLSAAAAGGVHRTGNARYRAIHCKARERPRRDRGVWRGRFGKIALLNALAGEKIFACRRTRVHRQDRQGWLQDTRPILVDTPGINEAAGRLRGKLAEERRAIPTSCCSSPTATLTGSKSTRLTALRSEQASLACH